MSRPRVLPPGQARILLVAAFFYGISILSVLLFGLTLLLQGVQLRVGTLFWGISYSVGAYYLLKGSVFAKGFLIVMSAISVFTAVGFLYAADDLSFRLVGVYLGIGGSCSLYLLTLSPALREEFERRSALSQREEELAKQRFYDEVEGKEEEAGNS